jgi:hypothetical protein
MTASCDRSLLMLKKSNSFFMILHHFDEVFMEPVKLLQSLSGARFDLMSPPSKWLGNSAA